MYVISLSNISIKAKLKQIFKTNNSIAMLRERQHFYGVTWCYLLPFIHKSHVYRTISFTIIKYR